MEERFTRAESINLKTGEFPMTLATEGEATDGHILSIRGGQLPESLPLQISHANDPQATLGETAGIKSRPAAQVEHRIARAQVKCLHEPRHRALDRLRTAAGTVGVGIKMGHEHLLRDVRIVPEERFARGKGRGPPLQLPEPFQVQTATIDNDAPILAEQASLLEL